MELEYGTFPYAYPIRTAEDKCRERYVGFRFVSRIPKVLFPNKDAYTLCYAYFRWFDDLVDSMHQSGGDVDFIVDRQKRFLDQVYSSNIPEEMSTEELFLAHLVMFDQKNHKNLRLDLERLVGTLEFDSKRKNRIISSTELDTYIEDNTVPYVNVSLAIFNLEDVPKNEMYRLAKAGFITDYLASLKQDISLGYINISREDIERFGIDINNPHDTKARLWLSERLSSIKSDLSDDEAINSLPLLARTVARSILWKRKAKLQKLIATI